jgi:hypothetical protein
MRPRPRFVYRDRWRSDDEFVEQLQWRHGMGLAEMYEERERRLKKETRRLRG